MPKGLQDATVVGKLRSGEEVTLNLARTRRGCQQRAEEREFRFLDADYVTGESIEHVVEEWTRCDFVEFEVRIDETEEKAKGQRVEWG